MANNTLPPKTRKMAEKYILLSMQQKIKKFYDQHTLTKFLIIAASLALVSDILNMLYISHVYLPETLHLDALRIMAIKNLGQGHHLGHAELSELRSLMIQTMNIILGVFLLIHTAIYFTLAKNKKYAKKYVKGYSLIGIIFTLMMIPAMLQMRHYQWILIMLLTCFFYLYIYLGLRYKEL